MSMVARRPTPSLLVVLLAGSVITMVSMGLRSTMGVFLDPMTDALGVGAVREAESGAIQDRHGPIVVQVNSH